MGKNWYLDHKGIINKLGIFVGSLLVTVLAVYVYSPISGSHATEDEEAKISVGLNTTLSLNIDVNRLDFSFQPSEDGTFLSQPITATVSTNSADGYELYFSSIDNETDMINAFYGVNDVISSGFNGTVTNSTMTKNTWGYSLNNTDFSKIPTLSNQLTVKSLDHIPSSAEKTSVVNIGIKVASDIAAGSYEKSVVFSTIAHESVAKMQEFSCSDLPNVGDTTVLMDVRNGKNYRVGRLADNQCWMLNELGIGEGAKLTSADSDLPEGMTYTLGNSVNTNFGTVAWYTFGTATAGWGNTSSNYVEGANSPQSICPKGWRLPTGGPNSDFSWLIETYSTIDALSAQPFNFNINNSYTYSGTIQDGGVAGLFSSTTSSLYNNTKRYYMLYADASYIMGIGKNITNSATTTTNGYNVRCIARN